MFLIIAIGVVYSTGIKGLPDSDSNRKQYIFIISAILILQSGLRNVAVGTDTYAYFDMFETVKTTPWDEVILEFVLHYTIGVGKDPGFMVFEKIVQIFISDYQGFLFLIAMMFFPVLGNFIYKNTTTLKSAILAYVIYAVLFYSFFSITGHRQTIATAATLIGFEWIKQRKLIRYVILILVASTIHQSCLIFLPFYFIARIKRPDIILWPLTLFFPLLLLLSSKISLLFIGLSQSYEEYGHMEEFKPVTLTVMLLIVSLLALFRYTKVVEILPVAKMQYAAMVMAVFFLSLVFEIHAFLRIVQYFSVFIMVLVPLSIQSLTIFSKQIQNIIYAFLILLLVGMYVRSNIGSEYKFFWQEMQLNDVYL
ncbi:EpsG family protein [Pedobacter sp. MC2016-24]|uniref:EpsG family protein n=1 Tax=Pedobacter sp. MC2016-24 TaxID=2780090 RepID=UPI00187E68F3|nr:EpsG family protein [Pedobacter sp. MC2016-24]MBE9600313.1 EpsG family protein [Pedobacter sp. MC2016-24]